MNSDLNRLDCYQPLIPYEMPQSVIQTGSEFETNTRGYV